MEALQTFELAQLQEIAKAMNISALGSADALRKRIVKEAEKKGVQIPTKTKTPRKKVASPTKSPRKPATPVVKKSDVIITPAPALLVPSARVPDVTITADIKMPNSEQTVKRSITVKPLVISNQAEQKKVAESYRRSVEQAVDRMEEAGEKTATFFGPTYFTDVIVDLNLMIQGSEFVLDAQKTAGEAGVDAVKVDALTAEVDTAKSVLDTVEMAMKKRDQQEQELIDELLDIAVNRVGKMTEEDKTKLLAHTNNEIRAILKEMKYEAECTCRRLELIVAYLYTKGYLNPLAHF